VAITRFEQILLADPWELQKLLPWKISVENVAKTTSILGSFKPKIWKIPSGEKVT